MIAPRRGRERQGALSSEFMPDLLEWFRAVPLHPLLIPADEIERGVHAEALEERGRLRTDAPDAADGCGLEVAMDVLVRDGGQSMGLGPLRAEFGEYFGRGESDGKSEAELAFQIGLDLGGDTGIAHLVRPLETGDLGEAFIDAVFLDIGSVAADDFIEAFGEERIGLVVGGEQDSVGAELFYFE